MGLFYTGLGDKGKSVIGKKKISKTHPVMEALGDLDELNSLVGLIRNKFRAGLVKKLLREIQENLFIIQAKIAALEFGGKHSPPELKKQKIIGMEKTIDTLEQKIKPERGFIIAGETENSAWLDYARTVSRRAERSALEYQERGRKTLDVNIIAYLNRLSSLLFALARLEAKTSRTKEKHPKYK